MKKINPAVIRIIAGLCVLLLVVALLISNAYYQHIVTIVAIFAVLGLSWNILGGYAGVVSFGHAAFFGLGAFTVTLLLSAWNISPWLGIPAGIVLAALAAVLIGLPTLRLRGIHFALAMLAYPIVMRYVLDWLRYQEVMLPRKLLNAAWYMQFDDVRIYTVLATLLLFVCLCISHAIEHSRLGLALQSIKQNEEAAAAAGINVWKLKMVAIAISGAMAGAAGGLYVVVIRVAVPADLFGLHISAQAMVVTLFGGVGTLWGPLIGAASLIPLGEGLHVMFGDLVPGIQNIVYGGALILAMLIAPEGLYWYVRDRFFGAKRAVLPCVPPLVPSGEASRSQATDKAPPQTRPAPHAGPDLLVVQGLGKSFNGVTAVQDVGFIVPEGLVFGVIGQNGAGKTTAFNLLNGFIRADQGSARFKGHELVGLPTYEISRLGIGRTFQVARPFPRLSVLDNVVVGAISTEPDNNLAVARAKAAIATVGLARSPDALAGELNAVELRLLELARALAGAPRLVLLDEVFAGLAHDEIALLLTVIRRLPQEGVTVMIIEHTMQAMLQICDHLIVLDHGNLIAAGDPTGVINDPKVIEAYLGRKWMAQHAAA